MTPVPSCWVAQFPIDIRVAPPLNCISGTWHLPPSPLPSALTPIRCFLSAQNSRVHPLDEYLLVSHSVLGRVVGPGDRTMDTEDKSHSLYRAYRLMRRKERREEGGEEEEGKRGSDVRSACSAWGPCRAAVPWSGTAPQASALLCFVLWTPPWR